VKLALVTPEERGSWLLTLTGVQEEVAWFDEHDRENGRKHRVEIHDDLDATESGQ
jgi:hypothetical protein